jgi:hypothetical protein
LFAVLLYPLCYLALGFLSTIVVGGQERSRVGAAFGDLGVILLPSVLIYLISLWFVRPALRELSVGELAAGSLLVAVFVPGLIAASVMFVYARGNSQVADYAFFGLIPFFPPLIAFWVALRIVQARHRNRARRDQESAA